MSPAMSHRALLGFSGMPGCVPGGERRCSLFSRQRGHRLKHSECFGTEQITALTKESDGTCVLPAEGLLVSCEPASGSPVPKAEGEFSPDGKECFVQGLSESDVIETGEKDSHTARVPAYLLITLCEFSFRLFPSGHQF